jgi:hypothetical protein
VCERVSVYVCEGQRERERERGREGGREGERERGGEKECVCLFARKRGTFGQAGRVATREKIGSFLTK